MNMFLNVCVTGSSLRRCRHAVQQVSWRRRGEASGSVFMLTRFIQSADRLLTYWRLSRLKVWVPRCVKDVVLCKTQDLCCCREALTCKCCSHLPERGRVHTFGFFFKVFSLCFDLLYTLNIITGHWKQSFFKTPLMVKKLFSVLPSGRKQTEFLERWCRHAHVYQCL